MSEKDLIHEWTYQASGKVIRCPDCGCAMSKTRPGLLECTKCRYLTAVYPVSREQ